MISPTRNELLQNLVEYINIATSLSLNKIIRGNQNSPSPLDNYCSILYLTDIPHGTTAINIIDNEIDITKMDYQMKGERYYTFSIQFYRNGATDLAKQFMMFPETPTGKEFQQTALFTILKMESLSQNSSVISQNYEERAIISLDLIVNERQTIEINKVASVDIDFTFSSENSVDINEQIEVDGNG